MTSGARRRPKPLGASASNDCPCSGVYSPRLHVTRRCIEHDLKLHPNLVGSDARELCGEHDVISKFVGQRSASPDGGEVLSGFPHGCRSLHDARTRAVTYWDSEGDVCWLLCYHEFHAVGDRKDAYEVFRSLHNRDELFPTEDDYVAIQPDLTERFLEEISEIGADMLDEARAKSGTEVVDTIWDSDGNVAVVVDVFVIENERADLEEGWIGITLPGKVPWPVMDAYAIALELTGGAELLPCAQVGQRAARRGEIAFNWVAERPFE